MVHSRIKMINHSDAYFGLSANKFHPEIRWCFDEAGGILVKVRNSAALGHGYTEILE